MSVSMSDKGILERRIFNRLSNDLRVDTRNLFVDIKNGHVRLFGSVPTEVDRLAAEDDVIGLPGVGEVEDELLVQSRTDVLVSRDDAIRATIECLLELDPDTQSLPVAIQVQDQKVRVSGRVENYTQKSRIEEIAHNIPGVSGVFNQVNVELTRYPLR
jgi:osmotically-inducible protein OsmY